MAIAIDPESLIRDYETRQDEESLRRLMEASTAPGASSRITIYVLELYEKYVLKGKIDMGKYLRDRGKDISDYN